MEEKEPIQQTTQEEQSPVAVEIAEEPKAKVEEKVEEKVDKIECMTKVDVEETKEEEK